MENQHQHTFIPSSLKSLWDALVYARENSPYYKETLKDLELNQETFGAEVWTRLPFTTKEDLSNRNADFLSIPLAEVADYVTTSGTTGEPVTIYLSRSDIKRLARNEMDAMRLAGVKKGDVLQLTTTIDRQFMAGMAYYLGAQELEAGIIRVGPGVVELQWASILKYRPTYLIAVPSFLLALISYAKKEGIDLKATSVKGVICIGEAIRFPDLRLNLLGERIVKEWPVQLYSTYASTEMATAFTECEAQQGGHLNEALMFMEVIKENGERAGEGEEGEVVVTTYGVVGTPLIRYRTGDVARVFYAVCSCGRTSPRLGPVMGRKNQMIKLKGTTVFPQSFFEVLDDLSEVSIYKIIVSKDELSNDMVTLLLDESLNNEDFVSKLRAKCHAKLRVIPDFEFVEIEYLRSQIFKKNIRKPEKIKFV
jgi:phenylacetate-CoA ligase